MNVILDDIFSFFKCNVLEVIFTVVRWKGGKVRFMLVCTCIIASVTSDCSFSCCKHPSWYNCPILLRMLQNDHLPIFQHIIYQVFFSGADVGMDQGVGSVINLPGISQGAKRSHFLESVHK